METSKNLTEQSTGGQLTFFQEDFLASHSVSQEKWKVKMMFVSSGQRCLELLKRLGQPSLLRKMLVDHGNWSMKYAPIWKALGTKRNRLVLKLRALERITSESDSGLLPTPNHSLGHGGWSIGTAIRKRDGLKTRKSGAKIGTDLKWHPSLIEAYQRGDGTILDPDWLEEFMGYPLQWTELNPSETPSSRKSPSRSSKQLK